MNFLKTKKHRLACLFSVAVLFMSFVDWERTDPATQGLHPSPSGEVVALADPDGDGPRPGGVERVAGELYVDLLDELTESDLIALGREYGVDVRYSSDHGVRHNTVIVEVPEDRLPSVLRSLEQDPRVETVDPNYLFALTAQGEPMAKPNDPRYDEQWHMKMIDVEGAWPIALGRDVVTAVIDTGVAYRDFEDFHRVEDLDQTAFVPGYDFVNKRIEALDDQCHGTHVAGTIAQSTNNGKGVAGVAYQTRIMPVKVLSKTGSGTLADVADGIRFSADHGATVINMSLGGPFPSASLADAVAYAHRKGTIVVCAAGNSSTDRREYPAGFPEAVAISSVNQVEDISFYSNRGDHIALAAPGGDTRNFGPAGGVLQNTIAPRNHKASDYYFFQGTSMAAPHAAGVAALVASTGVTQPAAIERVLTASARVKEAPPQAGYGAGILDAKAAVTLSGVTYKAWQAGLAMLIALLAGATMLRRKAVHLWLLSLPTALLGSSGLFFLPLVLPCEAGWSNFWTLGLPSWGIPLMGAANHGNPLLLSCLIPMLLSIVVVEKPALRALVSGLAAGFAAHLLFAAAMGTVAVIYLPALIGKLWLLANGLLCVFLAVVLAEEHP